MLGTGPEPKLADLDLFAPAALYKAAGEDFTESGANTNRAQISPSGDDSVAAPMFALAFANVSSIAVLNPSPRGDTTNEDIGTRVTTVLLDDRFRRSEEHTS